MKNIELEKFILFMISDSSSMNFWIMMGSSSKKIRNIHIFNFIYI